MTGRLRKFMPRSPRYVLRPSDQNSVRFSFDRNEGEAHIEQTFLINISESGLALLVEPGFEIRLRDRVKVELPVPGGGRIAWWAVVRRMEDYEPRSWFVGNRKNPFLEHKKILVGLHFEDLPEGHARVIRRGLEASFIRAMRESNLRNWNYYRTLWLQTGFRFVLYVLLTVLALGFIYWCTIPDGRYDAKRGAPWGERYKF